MSFDALLPLAQSVIAQLAARGHTLATAESCTGGLVSAALTAIAGSSAVLDRGFVTYSNQAKSDLLGVPAPMLGDFGAVSQPVAIAMAVGAVQAAKVDWALSITGIAGPGGGSVDKPVGLVHFAWAGRNGTPRHDQQIFSGDRTQVRDQAAAHALRGLLEYSRQ